MKRKKWADEQIAFALWQAENGTSVEEVCRKLGVSEPTLYRWKKQFAGMGVLVIRRLHILLRREDWTVNHKRVYRLCSEEGLSNRQAAATQAGVALPRRQTGVSTAVR